MGIHQHFEIPNEIIGQFILDGLLRAERLAKAQRDATISLHPMTDYHEIDPIVAADAIGVLPEGRK